jgi:hypothetical protein
MTTYPRWPTSFEESATIRLLLFDLSTQLFGDFDLIMDLLKVEIRHSWHHWGEGVFAIKFLAGDRQGLRDL